MRWLWYSFLTLFSLGMLGLIVGIGAAIYVVSYYGRDLPDYSTLKDYDPPVVTRVYTGDGRLMAEFAEEKRIFVPVEVIPDMVKHAFISAEDKNFYEHSGVDYEAIARALLSNLKNAGTGQRMKGASTITQQVAKNFFLTNEVSFKRKIREAILASRMERAMSKDRLLELYLNQIYLGQGAYGVAAAALNYFGKPLDELSISEASYLAALPKAPSNYDPRTNYDKAIERRNWVIGQLTKNGYITQSQAEEAQAIPLKVIGKNESSAVAAPYFAEEVRRELREKFGQDSLYGGGMVVRTSINPQYQEIASRVLREGLIAYDKRHGWRGVLGHINAVTSWQKELSVFKVPASMPDNWRLAVVLKTAANEATIGLDNGKEEKLQRAYLEWAKPGLSSVKDLLSIGDVIMVTQAEEDGKKVWALRQIPKVNGAIVVLDPHTGRVLAMEGGWSYEESEFNRATQALRQPGSSFKPFVYLTALEQGLTPATLVVDGPVVIDQGPGLGLWKPVNYTHDFLGPTPLRVGIEKSRNLMTIRLAEYVGMEKIGETAKKFGVMDRLDPHLANCLGSGETTLLRMATGYAQFVNGGRAITPTFIDRIQDRNGKTIYRHDVRLCNECGPMLKWEENAQTPEIPDTREQIADPRNVYQIVSILEGVVQRGTATRVKSLNRPLAGKTGTTNESRDTWFIGFSPDLVVGVFVGFDEPKTLGKKETGSSVAVPVFRDFMAEALEDSPAIPFRIPPGIRQVQINADTGARAKPGDKHVIWESFLSGTEPTDQMYMLEGGNINPVNDLNSVTDGPVSDTSGTGGIY